MTGDIPEAPPIKAIEAIFGVSFTAREKQTAEPDKICNGRLMYSNRFVNAEGLRTLEPIFQSPYVKIAAINGDIKSGIAPLWISGCKLTLPADKATPAPARLPRIECVVEIGYRKYVAKNTVAAAPPAKDIANMEDSRTFFSTTPLPENVFATSAPRYTAIQAPKRVAAFATNHACR